MENYDKQQNISASGLSKSGNVRKGLMNWILPEDVPDLETYMAQQTERIFKTVIMPQIGNIIISSISMIFNINGSAIPNPVKASSIPRVSYDKAYGMRTPEYTDRSVFYKDPVFENDPAGTYNGMTAIEKAETIRNNARDILDVQGYISVAQLYDISGLKDEIRPEHNKYGWTTMARVRLNPTGTRCVLEFPFPVVI